MNQAELCSEPPGVGKIPFQIPTQMCVTLGKSLPLSEPLCLHV